METICCLTIKIRIIILFCWNRFLASTIRAIVRSMNNGIHRSCVYPIDSAVRFVNTYLMYNNFAVGWRYWPFEQLGPVVFYWSQRLHFGSIKIKKKTSITRIPDDSNLLFTETSFRFFLDISQLVFSLLYRNTIFIMWPVKTNSIHANPKRWVISFKHARVHNLFYTFSSANLNA